MQYITTPLGYIIHFCYNLLSNYGLAIVLFTFITKIVLFPVSVWTHTNSLKLIKIQPQLNRIKAKYYGEKDKISDEQLLLYKREHYHPFIGFIPMIIQIVLLMCVIEIIYNPLTYVINMDKSVISQLVTSVCSGFGLDASTSSIQLSVIKEIQNGYSVSGVDVSQISSIDLKFLCFDLASIPFSSKGIALLVPLFAGGSALALSLFQNKMNPLQAEQKKLEQIMTNSVSIGISVILGGFVPAGIGLYWICSNLFTMLQQVILNTIISPKKVVDYDELKKSKDELAKLDNVGKSNAPKFGDENYKRERKDYKRFFSVANKHLVIYSEGNGFYKYFEKLLIYILEHSNIIIHYVTSDPNDNIFNMSEQNNRIKAYYIGDKKLITLFMKMDADIVIMTMPDLENYHYKRSYIKKDVEYIYLVHGPMSTHMVMNKGCLDHFDTIFCVGDFQIPEIRKQEQIYNLPEKNLVVCGYGFLEKLYENYLQMDRTGNDVKKVLVAPSWQKDNILDSCLDTLIDELHNKGFNIVIRPHPEYVKRYSDRMDAILARYQNKNYSDVSFEMDFSGSDSIYNSDVVITDWSSTVFEFSYITLKPCIFIDTPPKIYNKDYKEIDIEPLELTLRNEIGKSFSMTDMLGMAKTINEMIVNKKEYTEKILSIRNKYVANFGNSAEVAGKYVIKSLIEKQKNSKEN